MLKKAATPKPVVWRQMFWKIFLVKRLRALEHWRHVGTKLSQIRQTEKIIEGFDILSFNSNVADVASDIAKKLKAKNKIIEFRDIFIAATAITNDMPLSTLNVKHNSLVSFKIQFFSWEFEVNIKMSQNVSAYKSVYS